ncbi:MAG: 5-oxoprolinase subunit PxpB [Eudoraea sp.]
MKQNPLIIKPFGEEAVLIEWPTEVSEEILYDILAFMENFKTSFPNASQWELIPAYNSLTIINSLEKFNFKKVKAEIEVCYHNRNLSINKSRYLWKLPVCYDLDFGIDLNETAQILKLEISELIEKHTHQPYTVYGIGFLPGFMYLGGLPKDLEIKRRKKPRAKVVKGSVGLAGVQTGIYPQDSPGGWNIIGNCPVTIFNPEEEDPCFVRVGDKVSFYSISRAEYNLHKIEAEVGIFKPDKIELNG